ncbi:unnamed protein product [Umbelopsis ramanniana]
MDQAKVVLQRMYGADAKYRRSEQQQAMKLIMEGWGQVLAILRTSEGKSLLYFLPYQLPSAGTTVVILPLVVLKAEMMRRADEHRVNAHDWQAYSNPDHLHGCPLIFVAVEQAVQPGFQAFLNRLHFSNQLDRVVFDECHLIITAASYRPAMADLPQLRQLPVQMVFLTGTLPPDMVPEFQEKMLMRGAQEVHNCPPNRDFVKGFAVPICQKVIERLRLTVDTRAIINCKRKVIADDVAKVLDGLVYYSDSGSVEENAKVLQHGKMGTRLSSSPHLPLGWASTIPRSGG